MENFDMNNYLRCIENTISKDFSKIKNITPTYDILDTEKTKQNKLISLKEKQRQMIIGNLWQDILGNYNGNINLKTGHSTGLDILSHDKKYIIELKNRTNTDNNSSKKANLDKLAKFKMENPEYRCIYANINEDTENKTLIGSHKIFQHDGVELEKYTGRPFIEFILDDNTDFIINFVKETIDKYYES